LYQTFASHQDERNCRVEFMIDERILFGIIGPKQRNEYRKRMKEQNAQIDQQEGAVPRNTRDIQSFAASLAGWSIIDVLRFSILTLHCARLDRILG